MYQESLDGIWEAVCAECKKTVSPIAFNCFLKDLKPVKIDNGAFVLSIGSEFMRDQIEENYTGLLADSIKKNNGY